MTPVMLKPPEIEEEYIKLAKSVFERSGLSPSDKEIGEIARALQKFKNIPRATEEIASQLGRIAEETKSGKTVTDAAACISGYEKIPEAAKEIADRLGWIAIFTKSGKAVTDAAACISGYENIPEAAKGIAFQLELIAYSTKSGEAVTGVAAFFQGDASFFDKIIAGLKDRKENAAWLADWKENAARLAEEIGRTINHISRLIDDLHDRPELRKRIVGFLSPAMCYVAIGQGEEVFTSSFNLIFERMAEALGEGNKEKGYGLILEKAREYDPHRLFYAGFIMKVSYFGAVHRILSKETYSAFVNEIIGMMRNKNDASLLSVVFEKTIRMRDYSDATKDSLFKAAGNEELDPVSRKACRIIINFFKNEFKGYDVEELTKDLSSFEKYNPRIWMEKQKGEEFPTLKIKQYFYYEDENDRKAGIPNHRKIFIRQLHGLGYRNVQGLTLEQALESKDELVYYYKDREGRRIEYILAIAKEDVDLTKDLDDPTIDIIGHRGHSYQVGGTFARMKELETPKLFFLGSCGGFHVVPKLKGELGPNSMFVSTKNMGKGLVNNDILIHLAEAIAYENRSEWGDIKDSIFPKLGAGREEFKNYSFPGDLPQILLEEL